MAALWFLAVPFSPPSPADVSLAYESQGRLLLDHATAAAVYQHASAYAGRNTGAFPLAPLLLGLWLFGLSLAAAKLLQYVLIVATFTLLAVLVRKISHSSRAAVLAVIGALAAWQFRNGPDPVLGTSLVVPWAADITLSAYIAWVSYRETRGPAWLVSACIALGATMLCGPAAWALALALVLWAVWKRDTRKAALFLAAVFAVVTATITRLGPLAPWTNASGTFTTALRQIVAAIPASYRAFQNLPVGTVPSLYHNGTHYVDDRFIFFPGPTIYDWLAIALCALIGFLLLQRLRDQPAQVRFAQLCALGVAFFIVPAFFFDPSQWPHGLRIGQAFDVVYYQYLGAGVLLSTAVLYAVRQRGSAAALTPAIAVLGVLLICYGNTRADEAVIGRSARIDGGRIMIARAAKAGFFNLLPAEATIVLDPRMPFEREMAPHTSAFRYMIYDLTQRQVQVEGWNGRKGAYESWMLGARSNNQVLALYHLAGDGAGAPVTDRVLAYSANAQIWTGLPGVKRGMTVRRLRLSPGAGVRITRTCGPVTVAAAFAESRPAIEWGAGFFHQGPVGYAAPPEQLTPLGDVASWPKMFMGREGRLRIVPTSCTPAFVNLRAVAVGGGTGKLYITSPNGHVDIIKITTQPSVFWLRYNQHNRRPIDLRFRTDAPESNLDPVNFRYERDVPRHIRLVVEPIGAWEDTGQPE